MGIGGVELLLVLLGVLVLFGGKKIPELARGLGKSIRAFKKAKNDPEGE
ncbi:MAG: twin-arginine translocase TatA/TatE family subunit [Chlorobiaceae bacterium]|nr:twin-arginine translocase TatA/TatE family subunit [Chlorobiaceae bacterium]